jgi:hypothetical protein
MYTFFSSVLRLTIQVKHKTMKLISYRSTYLSMKKWGYEKE